MLYKNLKEGTILYCKDCTDTISIFEIKSIRCVSDCKLPCCRIISLLGIIENFRIKEVVIRWYSDTKCFRYANLIFGTDFEKVMKAKLF